MNKSLHLILMALLIFASFSVKAQDDALGFEGGISTLNFTNGGTLANTINGKTNLALRPQAALSLEFKYTNTFSLQPMIEYSPQGSKNGGFTTGTVQGTDQFNVNNKAELDYLIIPVLAKFGWTFRKTPFRFFIAAGPIAGYLLAAKQTIYDNAPNADNGEDIKSNLHDLNAGLEGKLGLIYILGRHNLFIESGANYGLYKIQKIKVNSGSTTGSLMISLGYSYWFGTSYSQSGNSIKM